jgi:flagellar basal-body rod protein FlgB
MRIGFPTDATIEAMGSYLGRLSKRQQTIASNLANIDTPGYRTKDITFHATMAELLSEIPAPLRVTRPEHNAMPPLVFAAGGPAVFDVDGLSARPDQNNVDLDREMLKLGETSFGYTMIVQLLRGKFRTIATSINEGRVGA